MFLPTERIEDEKSTAELGRNSAEAVRKSDAVVISGGAKRHGGAGGMGWGAGAARGATPKAARGAREAGTQRGREGPAPTARGGGATAHGGGAGRGCTMRPRTALHSKKNIPLCLSLR